ADRADGIGIEGVARPLHPCAAHNGARSQGRKARALRRRTAPRPPPPPRRNRRRPQAHPALEAQGAATSGGVMADNPYAGLRSLALGTTAETLKLGNWGPDDCYGILMETGYETAVATLVCFVTGDTSLYFSNGGGVIGAGKHANV